MTLFSDHAQPIGMFNKAIADVESGITTDRRLEGL